MRLKTGYIVWFRYAKYKHDRRPLALILYGGGPLVHAINLHYLDTDLNDKVINFIIKIISKELSARDMRALYHDYLKKKLHPVIQRAYRTYKIDEIAKPVLVSRGFHETVGYLDRFTRKKYDKKEINQIKKKIKKQIKAEKEIAKKKQIAKLTPKQLDDAIKNYVKQMSDSSQKLQERSKKGKYTRRK